MGPVAGKVELAATELVASSGLQVGSWAAGMAGVGTVVIANKAPQAPATCNCQMQAANSDSPPPNYHPTVRRHQAIAYSGNTLAVAYWWWWGTRLATAPFLRYCLVGCSVWWRSSGR